MSQVVRMQTECPPDAHKVIRPPEQEVKALLCVKLNDAECEFYGEADFCQALGLMSAQPLVSCSEGLRKLITDKAPVLEQKPRFLQVYSEAPTSPVSSTGDAASLPLKEGHINYADGSQSQSYLILDLVAHPELMEQFLSLLEKPYILVVPPESMLILRSISTVYPWDKLLASDYLRQYLRAHAAIGPNELQLFLEVRYGRREGYSLKSVNPQAYAFLQLERKLYLQYPDEDDD